MMPMLRRAAALALLSLAPCAAMAQTDYYNLDAHRPLQTEDALALERHGLELQLAPLTLERGDDGTYVWMLAPSLGYGILPRTQVELGAPFVWNDPGAVGTGGALAGLELEVLHQLQVERSRIPALALGAHLSAPVGGLAHDAWFGSVRAIATRTFAIGRVHLNGEYTAGPSSRATGAHHASRWMAGLGVDRALPLRSLLIAGEVTVMRPLGAPAGHDDGGPAADLEALAWRVGAGARWQWTPRLTIDAGLARTTTGAHRGWELTFGIARAFAIRSLIRMPEAKPPASNDWAIVHEQAYLPAEHNWAFRREYAGADRMFNAFDYGHAILYETLFTRPGAPVGRLEQAEYDRITRRILTAPPRLPLEEGAIEVEYAKLVPEVKAMFEWAHVLHRQLYDVWADERIPVTQKDARVAEVMRYYRSRRDIAFSTVPKRMELMEGQPYSLAFRKAYPKFNGLIWAYHWLQIGLYDALMAGQTPTARQANVNAAVGRFWQMLEHSPEHLPRLMPMGPAVAPLFSARYPDAAIVFDNLHSLHDVVSDILASPLVARERKRAAILAAAARYRDDASEAMTREEWREMALAMGAHNMGGPATGFTSALPTPTVPIGASHLDAMGHRHTDAPAPPRPTTAEDHREHGGKPPL